MTVTNNLKHSAKRVTQPIWLIEPWTSRLERGLSREMILLFKALVLHCSEQWPLYGSQLVWEASTPEMFQKLLTWMLLRLNGLWNKKRLGDLLLSSSKQASACGDLVEQAKQLMKLPITKKTNFIPCRIPSLASLRWSWKNSVNRTVGGWPVVCGTIGTWDNLISGAAEARSVSFQR